MRLLVKEYSQYDWANTNASIIHYIHFVFTVSQWMGHPFYASADTQHFFAVAAAFFSSYTYTRGVVVALDVVTLQNSINNIRSTCRAEKKMFVTPKRTMLNQHQIFTHSMEVFGLNFKIHVFILKKKMYEIKKNKQKKRVYENMKYILVDPCVLYIYIFRVWKEKSMQVLTSLRATIVLFLFFCYLCLCRRYEFGEYEYAFVTNSNN